MRSGSAGDRMILTKCWGHVVSENSDRQTRNFEKNENESIALRPLIS